MKEFLIYMVQSAVCLSFFGVVYILFLRKQTFFKFNRIFLLIGLVLSFIIPSIEITYDVIIPSIVQGDLLHSSTSGDELIKETGVSIWLILGVIYFSGIVLVAIRNLRIFSKVNRLMRNGKSSIVDTCHLIEHQNIKSSFSIFNYVFMQTHGLQNEEKDIILKHEISHVKQKHWIDLLCSECALLLQWFNPLLWYYIHLQKENHEYLADQAVLNDGESIAVYRAVLINQRFQGPVFSFANSFNYLNQQNRLTMMNKTKTSPWKKVAVLAILPLFGVFFALSATPNYVMENKNDTSLNDTASLKKDTMTVVGIATGGLSIKDFDNGKDKPLVLIDGQESTMKVLVKMDSKEIENISVLKNQKATEIYGEKGKDGVIIVTTKAKLGNGNEPIKLTVTGNEPIDLNLQKESVADQDGEKALLKGEIAVMRYVYLRKLIEHAIHDIAGGVDTTGLAASYNMEFLRESSGMRERLDKMEVFNGESR